MRNIFTTLLLLLTISFSALAAIRSGDANASKTVKYEFDTTTGVLHIYGNGDMGNYKGEQYSDNTNPNIVNRYYYPNSSASPISNFRDQVKTVIIDEGVTSIGGAFFYKCANLTSVSIPSSVTNIDYEAFRGCGKLQTVTIGAGVTSVKERSFTDCGSLSYIYVDEKNTSFVSVDGVLYTADLKTIVRYPEALNKLDYVVPEGVVNAETDALYKLKYVTSVTIPTSMTSIRYGSFDNSYNLTSLVFKSTVPPTFGKKDLVGLGSLKDIYVPCGAESAYKNSNAWGGFNTKSVGGSVVVDFRVYSNDITLGDVKVTSRADCSTYSTTIEAIPTNYGRFVYWEGEDPVNTSNPRTIKLPATGSESYVYTAHFEPKEYTITLVKGSDYNGVLSQYQVSMTDAEDSSNKAATTGTQTTVSKKFKYGDVVTLYCELTPGKKFTNWADGSLDNPRTITVTGNATYTAYVSDGKVTIKTQSSDTGLGTASPASQSVNFGESVTIKATPKSGYQFLRWDDGDTNATRSVVATADKTYTAYFERAKYTVAVTVDSEEMGSVSGFGTFLADTTVNLTATANANYKFVGWTGTTTSTNSKLTISNLSKNYDLVAKFKPVQFTITYKYPNGTVITTQKVDYNTMPAPVDTTMASTAQYDYTFTGWSPALQIVTGDATYTALFSSAERYYNITFKDENGTQLQKTSVKYGVTPVYNGKTPTKAATAQYTYTFNGWDKTVVPVTQEAVYTAVYTKTTNTYDVIFVDEDGTTEISKATLAYGATPSKPADPKKASDVQYDYTFSGWTPTVTTVTGKATYKATYSKTLREYTITFKDGNGNILGSPVKVKYGQIPSYSGATPTKTQTDEYTYTFNNKWSPAFASVTGDATYTAQFDAVKRKYQVTYYGYDGTTILQQTNVTYGETPKYNGTTPTKPQSAETKYKFNGWSPVESAVTGNASYVAQFVDGDAVLYTITFKNSNGTTLTTKQYKYNDTPAYNGTPTLAATKESVYTFKAWSPAIVKVTGDKTYTATYTTSPRPYSITFVDEDGVTVLQKSDVNYGVVPTYNGATPTKDATAEYTYTFDNWSPTTAAVTGEATYKAVYKATKNKYTVTFVDYDNRVIKTEDVEYGSKATAPANPTRTGYKFSGWQGSYTNVTKPVTIKAAYTINKYKITFKNDNGVVLDEQTIDYNTTPTYAGTPHKDATAQYTYTFKSWDKEVVPAVADVVYTATYNATLNSYTVVFYAEDGETPLQTLTVDYGTTPEYTKATPSKTATVQYTYTFAGWSPKVVAVTGPASYKATFNSTVNEYQVSFTNWDGSALSGGTKKWKFGETPYYSSTPSRAGDAQYSYVFSAWDPDRYPVNGPQVYKAVYQQVVNQYEIKFVDYDGKLLYKDNFEYGTIPQYKGETPTRASNGLVNYTFTGWSPDLASVTGNKTYTAQYSTASIIYTIKFVDYDDNEIVTKKLAAGTVIDYNVKPTRESDANYSYEFTSWYPALTAGMKATSDMTFKAQYDATWREYNVRFEKDDHTEIVTNKVRYGDMPTTPPDPTKAQTDQYTYKFAGWNKDVAEVVGDVTYTAVFTPVLRKYLINFVDYDGKSLQSKEYEYGTKPTCVSPSREADAQYTYYFDSWTPAVSLVAGDATYKATYTTTTNQYTVTFKNEDGTVIESGTYNYGVLPSCSKTPVKAATKEFTYTFAGWNKDVVSVSDNVEYVATYSSVKNSYSIVFADEEGKAIKTYSVQYGVKPVFDGTTPTKPASDQFTYTFGGWQPAVVEVVDNATYKATFTSVVNKYSVVFKNYDGTVLQTESLEYGSTPVYKAASPVKSGNKQYSYTFKDWTPAISAVKGDATYTADFDESVNSYVIKFVNYDNSVLQESLVKYGETPSYKGDTPTRPGDKLVNYTFKSWSPVIENVVDNATYVANYTTADNVYTIDFVDYDGKLLLTKGVESDEEIVCGITPTRESSVDKVYTFSGWSPKLTEGMKPTEDMTFTAQYSSTPRQYLIRFVMDDGTEIQSGKVDYGTKPTEPTDVKKASTAQYSYTFKQWDKTVVNVTGDATYTAVFTSNVLSYNIKFCDYDGTVLQSKDYEYGSMPSCEEPTRTATAQFTYTFKGWDKQIVAVEGEATYNAEYSSVVNKYTVTFKNEDGTVLQSTQLAYDDKPEYNGTTPTKAMTDEFEYSFADWNSEIVKVKGDAVYTATFTATRRKYDIIFADESGTTITTVNLEYGDTPVYGGDTPVKVATAQYTYNFEKWTPDIVAVTGEATYKAQFSSAVNKYKVAFVNHDGSVVEENNWDYGSMPECGVAPAKNADAQFSYQFTGWDRDIVEVTGEAVYTAQFTSTVNKYKITFVNYDDAILFQDYFDYGAVPSYTGTPQHPSDGIKNYTFMGWSPNVETVTGEATYKAIYSTADVIYTMTFVDYDDTELMVSKFEANAPIVCSIVPTRQSSDSKTYVFKGWNPQLTEGMVATKDITFKAQYTESARTYNIRFLMDNGAEIANVESEYGKLPVAPTGVVKASDSQYSYTFDKWEPELANVTGEATYTAKFKATTLKYKVVFANYDGSILQSKDYEYGETPTCDEPSRNADVKYSYSFAGWDKQVVAVTADVTYKATYNSTLNKYTITLACNDNSLGNVTGGGSFDYGSKVSISAKAEDNCKFLKWNDGDTNAERTIEVTGDATYTADFEFLGSVYTIKFINEDGSLLRTMNVKEGDVITADFTPTREPNDSVVFTFYKWEPYLYDGFVATSDMTFTAFYYSKIRQFHVTFVMDDGVTEIASGDYEYGTIPGDPTYYLYKKADSEKGVAYEFDKWSPELGPITSDTTFVAQFIETDLFYRVFFINYDGTVVIASYLSPGEMPTYHDLFRPSDQYNSYVFKGWDKPVVPAVADENYYAQYDTVPLGCNVSVISDDINKGTVTGGGVYPAGSVVTVNAIPAKDCFFVRWNDGDTHFERTFTVYNDIRLIAIFADAYEYLPEGWERQDPEKQNPVNPQDPEKPNDPNDPNNPDPEVPVKPEEPLPIEPDPEAPCYNKVPGVALYDWLLMVDKKSLRLMGVNAQETDVTWYRIVGEQDNACDTNAFTDDEVVSVGFYYTSEKNLIGTGMYYAVVNVNGVLFRTQVFDFSKGNKAMILPNRANPGQTLQIKGIDGEATIEVYDIYGRLVRCIATDGSSIYEIPAESNAGVYVVRIKDSKGSVLKYLVK